MRRFTIAAATALALVAAPAAAQQAPTTLLNASYDIARELFVAVNTAFIADHKAKTGVDITIDQSARRLVPPGARHPRGFAGRRRHLQPGHRHRRAGRQGRPRLGRLEERNSPNDASPYYSLPAFLVRSGNPKNIKDWGDLVRDDVKVIFPNPKTSGNARYTYLAATAYAKEAFGGDQAKVEEFVSKLFDNVAGVRHRRPRRYDHLRRARDRRRADHLRGGNARHPEGVRGRQGRDRHPLGQPCLPSSPWRSSTPSSTSAAAATSPRAYLDFLYTTEGQRIVAQNGNRVHDPVVVAEFKDQFPKFGS